MEKVSDTINEALVLADNATQSAARLAKAMTEINDLNSPLIDEETLSIFQQNMNRVLGTVDTLEDTAILLSLLVDLVRVRERKNQ